MFFPLLLSPPLPLLDPADSFLVTGGLLEAVAVGLRTRDRVLLEVGEEGGGEERGVGGDLLTRFPTRFLFPELWPSVGGDGGLGDGPARSGWPAEILLSIAQGAAGRCDGTITSSVPVG